jgi:hypothetical protein
MLPLIVGAARRKVFLPDSVLVCSVHDRELHQLGGF